MSFEGQDVIVEVSSIDTFSRVRGPNSEKKSDNGRWWVVGKRKKQIYKGFGVAPKNDQKMALIYIILF